MCYGISRCRWILLAKARGGARSARKSKTRNTARTEEPRDSGRDRRVVVPEDGKRRKREAPNTQHNPAASSASMDFKRSPRLLLFPFLSFSFFYYYFRGADGCALAPAHGVCVRHVCVHVRASVCIRVCIRIHSSQVELDLGWVGCVETMDDFG